MLHVAGGTYLELCIQPVWNELFGSGVRATVALSALSKELALTTYVDPHDVQTLEAKAAVYGFKVHHRPADRISFKYFHGLSTPLIAPHPVQIHRNEPHHLEEPNILRFGFLEGDAVVHGDRVVYDPQSVFAPAPFHQNGSTAKHLAIVLNSTEAMLLTGSREVEVVGKHLISNGAEVVVLKRGSIGYSVITPSEMVTVPPFETDFVWPIGSGDVFSAIFAHFWAVERRSPIDAARHASLATASYCNSTTLPIIDEVLKGVSFEQSIDL